MAYSPIPINEATASDLQKLRWVGPKRAERILQYRAEVSDIFSPRDLVTATGLGPRQISDIINDIDWYSPASSDRCNLPVVCVSLSLTAATILFSFTRIDIYFETTPTNVYNLALILVLAGASLYLLDLIADLVSPSSAVRAHLVLLGVTFALIGVVILLTLLGFSMFGALSSHFADHVQTTFTFLMFVLIVVYLSNGPSIHVVHVHDAAMILRRLDIAAKIYDYGQLILPILVLSILFYGNSELWFEEIFSIWASVMLIINGVEMIHANSPYVANLSVKERATLRFMQRHENMPHDTDGSGELPRRPAGWLSVGFGLVIIYLVVEILF